MHQPQPRSGKRSVAHGVSRGYGLQGAREPQSGETRNDINGCSAPAGAGSAFLAFGPMAHAMGYRSFAAPRLISARLEGFTDFMKSRH
jgi:hypothetical protein